MPIYAGASTMGWSPQYVRAYENTYCAVSASTVCKNCASSPEGSGRSPLPPPVRRGMMRFSVSTKP